ncbi:MAG: GNAT family N-acetyltransferase [Bacillota bacterium]|nr:MAG: GNAT family N-acetyltransferase [Bacillota bacterium]
MSLPALATERLLLRPVRPDDAPAIAALLADSEGPGGFSSGPAPLPGQVAHWIAEQEAGWAAGTHYSFAVHTRAGDFVGVVQLRCSPSAPRAELGFATVPALRSRGYATEACQAVLRFAFEHLGLKRVSALCRATNRASARVLEKLGFRMEARIEPDVPPGAAREPLLFYAVGGEGQ